MQNATEHVYVALGDRSYEIEIGTGNLPRLGAFARPGCVLRTR